MPPNTLDLVWSVFIFYCVFFGSKALEVFFENQKDLVQDLIKLGDIKSDKVAQAMFKVDRQYYIKCNPYGNFNSCLGYKFYECSPPQIAFSLERLKNFLKPGSKVLDIGSGCGYMTACLALMLGDSGLVIGIDHLPHLTKYAHDNVMKANPQLIKSGRIKFVTGDGRLGYDAEGPYDAIHVGGMLPAVPLNLIWQLKHGGRMVIPLGNMETQNMTIVDKDMNGTVKTTVGYDCYYFPLNDRDFEEKWMTTEPIGGHVDHLQ